MDYGVLNSLRVGAISGVAAKYLAPKGAKVMGLLGSGWQSPPQVQSITHAVPGLELIRVYSPTKANRETFAARMTEIHGVTVEAVDTIEEAVRGADIVDLCAPGHFDVKEPLLEIPWVKPGALVISMAASQLTEEFVQQSSVATVNWQSLAEEPAPRPPYSGLIEKGLFSRDDVTELGPIMDGKADPRRTPDDTVIYDLTGGNVHDLFLATWAYEWAKERGLGSTFTLTGEDLPRDR
jgi:ornithine cyclodeaminase